MRPLIAPDRSEEGGGPPIACSSCGVLVAGSDPAAAVTWCRGIEHGRVVWTCPTCTRVHARGIEGKLDSDWW